MNKRVSSGILLSSRCDFGCTVEVRYDSIRIGVLRVTFHLIYELG